MKKILLISAALVLFGGAFFVQSASAATYPSQILNLQPWKLTLPIDTPHAGSPDEIKQPELATYNLAPYFTLSPDATGVQFRAYVNGATTSGSGYPRSELREMNSNGSTNASWSSTTGDHTMYITQAITKTPVVKPHVVAGQIHDSSDDVVMIRLEGKKLFAEAKGVNKGTLDDNYVLGTKFTVRIQSKEGRVMVFYNGVKKVSFAHTGSGMYFKAGAYTQSNLSKGDTADAYGEVIVYSVTIKHVY